MTGARLQADFWITEYITPWDVYHHGVTRVLASKKTAFQQMYIVETGAYGKALVLDGKWQSCTGDEFLYHEPLVHPAMIAHGDPKKVLVLGGGEGATIREVLKWKSVARVVMVDLDGEVVAACREHLPEMHRGAFDDPRVELVIGDALDYVAAAGERWDVIISDLTDPIEEGPSFQLFTREYFTSLKGILSPGGVLAVQAGPVAPAEIRLHARVVKTLQSVFASVAAYASHVPTYASPWGFAVCSEGELDARPDPARIDRMLAEKTSGEFTMLDGDALLGLMLTPASVRRAIADETQIYTLADPPKFFGGPSQET